RVGERREIDLLDVEDRVIYARSHADLRGDVVLADERAPHVGGTDPDAEEDWLTAHLREVEALLDEVREGREAVARIQQRQARLERDGVGPLLENARPLTVVFADDDQRAADDPGRGDVRERVGGDIRADDRLPRHHAAHRIVERGAEDRGGR